MLLNGSLVAKRDADVKKPERAQGHSRVSVLTETDLSETVLRPQVLLQRVLQRRGCVLRHAFWRRGGVPGDDASWLCAPWQKDWC